MLVSDSTMQYASNNNCNAKVSLNYSTENTMQNSEVQKTPASSKACPCVRVLWTHISLLVIIIISTFVQSMKIFRNLLRI